MLLWHDFGVGTAVEGRHIVQLCRQLTLAQNDIMSFFCVWHTEAT
jgi:hypothetical protein